MKLTKATTPENTDAKVHTPLQRDWFGYFFTISAGIVVTLLVTWYQFYTAQKDAAAVEIEKVRSIKLVVVAIVEEHLLNGKRIEFERLARIIDQKRKEEIINVPILVNDVVEIAEISISSSRHLSVEKKEQIKPLLDQFYAEQRAKQFQITEGTGEKKKLVNEVAKKIQDGKSSEALSALKKLEELDNTYTKSTSSALSFSDFLHSLLDSPWKIGYLSVFILCYIFVSILFLKKMKRRSYLRNFGVASHFGAVQSYDGRPL